MSDHCVFVADDADIRQGDVIRRIETENADRQTWGFIITADCDIAQIKAGDRFTWLEIVRSDQFLEAYWAPEQLRRLVDRQTRPACDGLNGLIKRAGLQLSEVDGPTLRAWLRICRVGPANLTATLKDCYDYHTRSHFDACRYPR